MAPKWRTRKDEGTPPPRPTAKRQKAALDNSSVSRRNRATKEAAPNAPAATTKTTHLRPTTATVTSVSLRKTDEFELKKKPRINQRLRPPRKPQPKPKPRGLLSLPLVLQQHIFLHTSAKDTARLRRVCKILEVVVRDSTRYLIQEFSRKERKRIQQQVDEFASPKSPTDFDSVMKALHVWTKQRGTFKNTGAQQDSAVKLMMHLFRGASGGITDKTGRDIVLWSAVALEFVELCRDSDNGEMLECSNEMAFDVLTETGLLDYDNYDKLSSVPITPSCNKRTTVCVAAIGLRKLESG